MKSITFNYLTEVTIIDKISGFSLVHSLLDEILSSAVQRSLEPVLMEPGVVELICER